MATYEYNSAIDETEVTTGQAFEYENQIARKPASHKRTMHQINEAFRIQEVSGMFKVQYLQNGTWQYHQVIIALDGTPQSWWCFSYDEALALVQAYMTLFGWMSGIAASTPVQEETYEDMLAAQYNERLLNQVVYYTENSDCSERVVRLIKASRDGVLLTDPADPADQGCWYSFNQVSNIQQGRQYGWK